MEAVVRRIKCLIRDPDARLLVFSTWTEVLDVLSHALRENNIYFAYAKAAKQIAMAIDQLRQGGKGSVAGQQVQTLLLPVKQGGNGLNLTGTNSGILTVVKSNGGGQGACLYETYMACLALSRACVSWLDVNILLRQLGRLRYRIPLC